jgi:26S proteasome regulatory subunit N1
VLHHQSVCLLIESDPWYPIAWQVENLDLLVEHVDATNYKRTCLYLTSSSKYVADFGFTLLKLYASCILKLSCFVLCSVGMESCRYLPAPDDMLALKIAYEIYLKFGDLASALRIALLLDNKVHT